jgi:hypothetical protein
VDMKRFAGSRSIQEPVLNEVQYKDSAFVVRRYDVDISVLPNKYLNELRLYPNTKLSGVKAQVKVCQVNPLDYYPR